MGLFMLCACHNAIFAVLPCKHNGQAVINSTVEGKHSVCMHYIFTSKTNKGRIPSVSLISRLFPQKIQYTLLCVFQYLQIFAAKKASLRCVFPVFGLVLDIINYIESLQTDIQKSPCQSLKKISVTTFINSFVSAYNSTTQDLAARIHQNDHFQTKIKNSMTQR